MFGSKSRPVCVGLAVLATAALAAGCSANSAGGQTGKGIQAASSNVAVKASPDTAYLGQLGWTPQPNSVTNFACSDNSYANAVKNGIVLGIYSAPPYEYIDKSTSQPAGLDWDINMAVLKYIGVKKYTTVNLPWDGMIPALDSHRIDVITGNIHETPERLANIGFTSPAWWYGSALIVQKSNPQHITSWKDLTRPGVTVGVVNGSESQTYLDGIHAKTVPYEDANSEFTSLEGGRESVVVDDSPKAAAFIQANPNSGLEIINAKDLPPAELLANYARYGLRKSDCTLNFAYSRALDELRAHGVITHLLKKYGLDNNMFMPQYQP